VTLLHGCVRLNLSVSFWSFDLSSQSNDRFLHYYNQELTYLRTAGKHFAKAYPKIARRLELSDSESADPHVERLLESFAFLTGRIGQEIDDQYPQTATALLNILYPHLVNPVPSMAIAHFNADPSKGNLTKGFSVPKGTVLHAKSAEGISCDFTTVYPLTLWPIHVDGVSVVPLNRYESFACDHEWGIKINLSSLNTDFNAMQLDHLDFHIRADRKFAVLLYQTIVAQKS